MAANEIKIRRALPEDAAAIEHVLRIAFAQFANDYTAEALAYVTPASDEIVDRFVEGPMWVAETETGEAVGTVSVVHEPEWLYIRSMAVLPAAQGHGVGGKLLQAIEDHAFDERFNTLFLYTTHFSTDAIRLYEKHGFKRGRETTAEEWCGTPGFEMWKYLTGEVRTNAKAL